MQTTTLRRGAAALALAATLTGLAVAPALAATGTPYDFGDCPAIPAGVDATRWKCEVLTATGSLHLGSRDIPELAPMTITHAEGPLPDGTEGQVWGALRGGPTTVPGAPPGLGLALLPEYGGRSDFYSVGDELGLFTLRYRVVSPLLPHSCVIGGDDAPIEIRLKRVGGSEWVSKNPPVIKFAATDTAFKVPAATHCGPLGRLVNNRLGLPAPSGNTVNFSAVYTFKTYDQLPPR